MGLKAATERNVAIESLVASSSLAPPILGDTPAVDGQIHQNEPNRCNLVRTGCMFSCRAVESGAIPNGEP
jgi:hypothetical protein